MKCIQQREYIRKYRGYEKVLLVGINYSEKTKKHTCLTELVEQEV